MSGTTAGGLPYATGTDLIRDGDNAIKALADALESRGGGKLVQCGSNVVTTNVSGDVTWTFPKPFKTGTSPILLTGNGDPNSGNFIVTPFPDYTTATTGAARWRNDAGTSPANGANVRVQWIAIGTAP